jgi:hypothetical protein
MLQWTVRTRVVALAAGAFVIGAGFAFVVLTRDTPGVGRQQQPAAILGAIDSPIGPGATNTVGLPTDLSILPFPALLPATEDPSADVNQSWIRFDIEPALAVEFSSGVVLAERVAEAIDFPTDKYYEELAEGVPGGYIDQVNQASALVIQSQTDLGNPSSVDVILEGVHISIIGAVGQDPAELVALARSIPATGAGVPITTGSS